MTRKEIEDVILRCAGARVGRNGELDRIGSIAKSFDGEKEPAGYAMHYWKCKRELEALPWNVVDNPRNPKDGEYPSEDGTYITMLDCNEHEVLTNDFRGGFWTLYHKTHVKWWMKLPEAEDDRSSEDVAESVADWLNRKYDGSPIMKKIGEAVYRFVNENLGLVVAVAIFGIVMAVVGHYGKTGFDWRWFVFFELPLYLFLGWAVWKTIGIYRRSRDLGKKNNSEKA